MKYQVTLGSHEFELEAATLDGELVIRLDGREVPWWPGESAGDFYLEIDRGVKKVRVVPESETLRRCHVGGWTHEVRVLDELDVRLLEMGSSGGGDTDQVAEIAAPMPGRVVAVSVTAGDRVSRGQALVVLEAMKMENEIRSPVDATVAEVRVEAGQNVDLRQTLLRLEVG